MKRGPGGRIKVAPSDQVLEPCVEMEEQPQPTSIRFRYASEGNSHGGLQGISSQRGNKTFPTIVIRNHHGPVKIVVQLIAKDVSKSITPHAHELIGKGCENGVYVWKHLVDSPHCQIVFRHLSIQHVTKKTLIETLQKRILMQKNGFPQNYNPGELEMATVKTEATELSRNLPMNSARLCFRVYLLDKHDHPHRELLPAISDPIFDAKSPSAALLKICRIDRHAGSCLGGDEVFLLCDRVQKGDIEIEFYEVENDVVMWQANAKFTANDIHRQFAIVFTTPPYRDSAIEEPVSVYIRLYRPSDREMSEPVRFTYHPNMERDELDRKRRKTINFDFADSHDLDDLRSSRGSKSAHSALGLPEGAFSVLDTSESGLSHLSRPTLPRDVETDALPAEFDFTATEKSGLPAATVITHQEPVLGSETSLKSSHDSSSQPDIKTSQLSAPPADGSTIIDDVTMQTENILNITKQTIETVDDGKLTPEDISKRILLIEEDWKKIDEDGFKYVGGSSDGGHGPMKDKEAITDTRRLSRALEQYAVTGNVRTLLYHLSNFLSGYNHDRDSAIGLAIIHGREEAAINMCEVAAAVNPSCLHHTNKLGQSLLHLCVISKRSRVLNYLLGRRAHKANSLRILRLPLDAQDCNGNTFLHTAVRYKDLGALKALKSHLNLMRNNSPDYKDKWLNLLNKDGYSAVHLAVRHEDLIVLEQLYELGVDVNQPDGRSSLSPLHTAVLREDLAVTASLLGQSDIDVNRVCWKGQSALHYACLLDSVSVAGLLLVRRADPKMRAPILEDEDDVEDQPARLVTPLSIARRNNNQKMMDLLNGVEQVEEGSDGETDGGTHVLRELEGDMDRLHFNVRRQLAALLMASSDEEEQDEWRTLAEKLNRKELIPFLQNTRDPALALLDSYEATNGNLEDLYSAFREMERMDLTHLLALHYPDLVVD